jgi:hypothetical protein
MTEHMQQLIQISKSRVVLFELELKTARKLQYFSASYMIKNQAKYLLHFVVKLR